MAQLYDVYDIAASVPLSHAEKILKPETIVFVRQQEDISVHGCFILDRWATYQSEALLRLEADGELTFFHHLLNQQNKELAVLSNAEYAKSEKHLTIAERLSLHEIDTMLMREF